MRPLFFRDIMFYATRKAKHMETKKAFDAINGIKKGRYVSLVRKKEYKQGVTRITKDVVRLGVDYSKMKINAGRETKSLPWGHWVEGYEGLVIEHKGNHYLRVTSSYSDKASCKFFADGAEISSAEASSIIGESEVRPSRKDVFDVRFDNILSIGSFHDDGTKEG